MKTVLLIVLIPFFSTMATKSLSGAFLGAEEWNYRHESKLKDKLSFTDCSKSVVTQC